MNLKTFYRRVLISINVFCALNGLFALVMAYLLAAGADGVYHGIKLSNLAGLCALVFVAGCFVAALGWMAYTEIKDPR